MKRNNSIIITFLMLLASVITFSGCSDSEDNTPSLADKDRMEQIIDRSVPRIAEFCDNYGTYILYDFDQELDFAYQFQQATNWQNAQLEKLTKEEASEAIDFLYENFFKNYSDDFKKKYFPRKLLLVKKIKAQSLGISEPNDEGYHYAAANINSMTIAFDKNAIDAMNEEDKAEYLKTLNYILLGGYLVNVRSDYPVGEEYFNYSLSYYSSLMDPNRVQARHLPDEFFYNKGFFRPDNDESTYFVSAEEDLIAFTRNLAFMDEDQHDLLMEYPLVAEKMHYLSKGLHAVGVETKNINVWAEDFLNMDDGSAVAGISINEIITPTTTADMTFTVYRGSKNLARVEIYVNNVLQHTVSLEDVAEEARITRTIKLTDLTEETNIVEARLFEEGRKNPSATRIIPAYVVRKAMRLVMENSRGESWYVAYLNYDYTANSGSEDRDPNLSTIRIQKHATEIDHNTGVDNGAQYFWVLRKVNGIVTEVNVKKEVVDFTNYKSTYEPVRKYVFSYDDHDQLTGVTLDGEPLVTNVAYANGNIASYNYNGKPYTPIYDTSVTPAVRIDCLDEAMSGHTFKFKGDEQLNYFYIPGFPAVIPGEELGVPLQLFYSQYLFTELEGVWKNRWLLEGNTNMTEVTLDGEDVTWIYRFVLQQ